MLFMTPPLLMSLQNHRKVDNILVLCEKVQSDLLGRHIPYHSMEGNVFQENKQQLYGTLKTLQEVLILVRKQFVVTNFCHKLVFTNGRYTDKPN